MTDKPTLSALKREFREEFEKEFVATGADIEGMNRVEYRRLRESQVTAMLMFINRVADTIAKASLDAVEVEKDEMLFPTAGDEVPHNETRWENQVYNRGIESAIREAQKRREDFLK